MGMRYHDNDVQWEKHSMRWMWNEKHECEM